MRRVGIFSGTFDPVHSGHLAFARRALKAHDLDKVFFMVEPRPRRKQGVKAFEHRQAMVDLAIQGEPSFGSIVLEQVRFSADKTLPILKSRFKGAELYMLMGDDMLHHLGDWPHVDELLRDVAFIIGRRQDDPAEIKARIKNLEQTRGLKLRYKIFRAANSMDTSSQIRLAYKHGHTPAGLDPKVRNYINQNHLYFPS